VLLCHFLKFCASWRTKFTHYGARILCGAIHSGVKGTFLCAVNAKTFFFTAIFLPLRRTNFLRTKGKFFYFLGKKGVAYTPAGIISLYGARIFPFTAHKKFVRRKRKKNLHTTAHQNMLGD
jgi:hypothetical protein